MPRRAMPPDAPHDPRRAARTLESIYTAFVKSGTSRSLEEFAPALEDRLAGVPDPDLALTNFLRFIEATMSRSALFTDVLAYPALFDLLLSLFGSSLYLSDILVREPGLFRWLSTTGALGDGPSAEALRAETERIRSTFRDTSRRLDGLRRLHRREILRIGARDLAGRATVRETTRDLSRLADAIVDAAIRILGEDLERRYGSGPGVRFAVLGLGKLGGAELNYSSDIDLLFVYERDCEFDRGDGRSMSCEEFFNRLGEQLVVRLSEQSPEGTLYRVDMRLRPESGAGPLARSLRSYLLYYETRGELWERQMLLKARTVGGDGELGQELITRLEPFVYPRSFLQHPAEAVARLKARIEAAADDPEDVKLMRGGIRDVEFSAQTLQLLSGGKNPSVRTPTTLEAIDRLVALGELKDEEGRALGGAYELFRTLEHRLQIQLNTQTHTLPREEPQRGVIARLAGFAHSADMDRAVADAAGAVRRVFDRITTVPEDRDRPGVGSLLAGGAREEEIAAILASHGLRDVRQAMKSIRVMTSGTALTGPGDARLRDAFDRVAEPVMREIAGTPSPDLTLSALAVLVSGQRFPHQLVGLLGEPRFRHLALDICSMGPRLARRLTADPLLLETLATNPSALGRGEIGRPGARDVLVRWKRREELRALIRHILHFSSFEELSAELSGIADAVLTAILDRELRRARAGAGLAIVAVGKFGSRELGLDADLDLFFVGRPGKGAGLERCASAVVRHASAVSAEGTLYTVDTRLRPEGRNAPLVIDMPGFRRYLDSRASLWERQSFTRLRVVAGGASLSREIEQAVDAFVYRAPLPADWVAQILAMRERTESRSRVRRHGGLDLKLGAGGIMDIEFLAQMIQLSLGRENPGLRGLAVPAVLRTAGGVLSGQERERLLATHALLRRVETLVRLTLEERTTILPDGQALELLAALMGEPSGHHLHGTIEESMRVVRGILTAAGGRLR